MAVSLSLSIFLPLFSLELIVILVGDGKSRLSPSLIKFPIKAAFFSPRLEAEFSIVMSVSLVVSMSMSKLDPSLTGWRSLQTDPVG